MAYQNLWEGGKAEMRYKFVSLQTYIRKQEKSQVTNLTPHVRELHKEKQKHPKVNRRMKTMKIRAECNKIENKKLIQKLMQQRTGSLKRLRKSTNLWLESLRKREKTQTTPEMK